MLHKFIQRFFINNKLAMHEHFELCMLRFPKHIQTKKFEINRRGLGAYIFQIL